MGLVAGLTVTAPASMAAAAQATAMCMPSLSSTPSSTFSSWGTFSTAARTKSAHSAGVMTPAESQRVTAAAPLSAAAASTWKRKPLSARVASTAESSTCSVKYRALATRAFTSSSMAGAFLWHWYSICTGDTGTMMCSRGRRAPFTLSQAASTPSSVRPVTADKMEPVTTEAMVLLLKTSAFSSRMAGSSMTSGRRRSRVRAASTRSLKLRPRFRAHSRRVISEILMFFMVKLSFSHMARPGPGGRRDKKTSREQTFCSRDDKNNVYRGTTRLCALCAHSLRLQQAPALVTAAYP